MCRSLLQWWETPLCLAAHGDDLAFLQSPGTRKRFMYNSIELDGQKLQQRKSTCVYWQECSSTFQWVRVYGVSFSVFQCVCVCVCVCVCPAIWTTVFPKPIPRQHAGLHDIRTREKRTRKVASCSASSWHLIKSRNNNVEWETSLCGLRNKTKMTGECKTCTCINSIQVVSKNLHTDTSELSTGFKTLPFSPAEMVINRTDCKWRIHATRCSLQEVKHYFLKRRKQKKCEKRACDFMLSGMLLLDCDSYQMQGKTAHDHLGQQYLSNREEESEALWPCCHSKCFSGCRHIHTN